MIMSQNLVPSIFSQPNISNKSNLNLILNTNSSNNNNDNSNSLLYKTHGNYKSLDNFNLFRKDNVNNNNNQANKLINDENLILLTNKDLRASDSSIYHQNQVALSKNINITNTNTTNNNTNTNNNHKTLKHMEVSKFLNNLNLGKYEYKFLTNGYDDVLYLVYIFLDISSFIFFS